MTRLQLAGVVLSMILAVPAVCQLGPVAMDRTDADQRLYLLDESGRILVSDPKSIDSPKRLLVRVPPTQRGVSLLATRLWDQQVALFIGSYGLTELDSKPRILRYSVTGRDKCEWPIPEVTGGLGLDKDSHTLYFSGSTSGHIYSINLAATGCSGKVKPVLRIAGAQRLGALIVDPIYHFVYVADALKGSIFRVDVEHGAVSEYFRGLGRPVSLLLYRDILGELQIFVADAIGRRLWQGVAVDRSTPVPKPTLIPLAGDPLQEPSSLTLAHDNSLLIADRKSESLLSVSRNGGRLTILLPIPAVAIDETK